MPIQFHRQQRDYWCGPACVQMLVGKGSQAAFAKKLATNVRIGTSRQAIIRLLRVSGKSIFIQRKSTLLQLTHHTPALVNYNEVDGEDHYAIVTRITKTQVMLLDPWHGPNYTLPIRTFVLRWKNQKLREKYSGWMVAMR